MLHDESGDVAARHGVCDRVGIMIEYREPMKGNTVDIFLEPDGTLSFDWYNTEAKIMSDQNVTVEQLRKKLHKYESVMFVTENLGSATVNMWQVVNQLLDHIEQQDARIKALEEKVNSVVIVQDERIQAMQKDKDDQDTENWAHSEYSG